MPHGHNFVAIYDSFAIAEQVRNRLLAESGCENVWIARTEAATVEEVKEGVGGVPGEAHLRQSAAEQQAVTSRETVAERGGQPRFFDWLLGDVSERERERYGYHLEQNRAVVSVLVTDEALHDRVAQIMESYHPLDFDEDVSGVTTGIGNAPGARLVGTRHEPEPRTAELAEGAQRAEGQRAEGEQRLTATQEHVNIGKEEKERRVRIRAYPVEKPIEETLNLRTERVIVERRPLTSAAAGEPQQERTIEMVERREEPVIEKTATAEEVIVRKEAETRQETVHAVERETRVDVEDDKGKVAAEGKQDTTDTTESARTPPKVSGSGP